MSCLTLSAGAEQERNKGGNSEADGEGDQHADVSVEVLLHTVSNSEQMEIEI
jgi:hypothetical protein